MTMLWIVAIAVSVVAIATLCITDPKRRRTAGLTASARGALMRRALVAVSIAPGLVLALLGDAAAFLIWVGTCAICGWLLAQSCDQVASLKRRTN